MARRQGSSGASVTVHNFYQVDGEIWWSRRTAGHVCSHSAAARLGVIEFAPDDDTDILAMVSGLGPNIADELRADPELTEQALWRVFEVEGGGQVSLTNIDRFSRDRWRHAFIELSAEVTIERRRVLAACLDALTLDFAAYRAGWFTATYLALEPTDTEIIDMQTKVSRLPHATVPATVSFALTLLRRAQKAGELDAILTLERLPAATTIPAKRRRTPL